MDIHVARRTCGSRLAAFLSERGISTRMARRWQATKNVICITSRKYIEMAARGSRPLTMPTCHGDLDALDSLPRQISLTLRQVT